MADNRSQPATPIASGETIESVAFELFKAARLNIGSPEQNAVRCYRDAKAFMETTAKIRNGIINLTAIDNNPLDEAYAPNLKKTHPINLMSRHWGDVSKVRAAFEDIKNQSVESYETYGWGKPECNQARACFPAVLERASRLEELQKTSAN